MSITCGETLPALCMIPKFYQEVICAYTSCKECEPILSKESLYNQIIWGNRLLTYNRKSPYNRHLIDLTIYKIF